LKLGVAVTDRDALLRAICDNPDDDAPRLISTDWRGNCRRDARILPSHLE